MNNIKVCKHNDTFLEYGLMGEAYTFYNRDYLYNKKSSRNNTFDKYTNISGPLGKNNRIIFN